MMKRVIGLGGIFFKAKDPKALYEWYLQHLGIESVPGAGAMWRDAYHPEVPGCNVWAIFPQDTKYFAPSQSSFMINFRVENLDELLRLLREEGVEVDPKVDKVEESEYGKFAWIMDPEGNRVELWEPPKGSG
jgi:predicted enzyme related to lactoylglutathione lyase